MWVEMKEGALALDGVFGQRLLHLIPSGNETS